MARTFIRQDAQIGSTKDTIVGFVDNTAPASTMQTTGANTIADDLNNIRSMISYFNDLQTGNWYDAFTAPTSPDTGVVRGVQDIQDDLWALERKRVLVQSDRFLVDVTVPSGQNFVVLGGGQLPNNTTAAVGITATLGTVVAHISPFGGAGSLASVSGSSAISPKNLGYVVDSITHDPVFSDGRVIYMLLQSESNVDGSTLSASTPNRAQLSFVRLDATGVALELCPIPDIENKVIHYSAIERKYLEGLNEQDFLRGAANDVPSGTTVTLQVAYDTQNSTPVTIPGTYVASVEIADGSSWGLRDSLPGDLFVVTPNTVSGGLVSVGNAVGSFESHATLYNTFDVGITVGSNLKLGVTSAAFTTTVESQTGTDLLLLGARELFIDDGNRTGSTWALAGGMKFSDTTTEWDAVESAYGGEVSLLRALGLAKRRDKTFASVTVTTNADTDVGGVGGGSNLDAQLPDMSIGTFLTDYDVFLNGTLLRPGSNSGTNNDYYPGTSLLNGQLRFEFQTKVGDVLCVIPYTR